VKTRLIIMVLLVMFVRPVFALGPHEVLVLVNDRSADSAEIAGEYVKLRNIPEGNVVRLRLPGSNAVPPLEITPDEFTKFIWEPAVRAVKERGIGDQILAWVYSVDFPTTIKFTPQLSILGLTFLRNRYPDMEKTKMGNYVSPLFGGPDGPSGLALSSQTFDMSRKWLGDEMPLPCMMLGYTGERGTTKDVALQTLIKGVVSDGTAPTGTVYFVTSYDVRSTCRAWQYPKAVNELRTLNVAAVITNSFPVGGQKIIGIMCGTALVNPEEGGNVYLPGSMAEHLTSMAGIFGSDGQTKLTAWLKAGATASAGTITEPFAVWTKFPCARFYVHYASGCTMIESYYQSIRCPLQILLIGDPLAQPWASKADVIIEGLEKETITGTCSARAEVQGALKASYRKFEFLLDGKVAGNDKIFQFDSAKLAEGSHVLRAVAYKTGFVRSQVFGEKKIVVKREK